MVDFSTVMLRSDRYDISYVHYIIEGYDGLGIVSTKDPENGTLIVTYPVAGRKAMFDLIHALRTEGVIKEVIET